MTADQRIAPWIVQGTVAASASLLLYLVWRSLRWPLIHDTALMHYIAWPIGSAVTSAPLRTGMALTRSRNVRPVNGAPVH